MKEERLRLGFTDSEYLLNERLDICKHEFFKGVIFPMPFSGSNHAIITKNVSDLLIPVLNDQLCTGFDKDMRLHIPQSRLYTYTDFMVVCGIPELMEGSEADNLLNPILIVEICSASTKFYDQGRKFLLYQAIPTLRQYILIDSAVEFEVESFSFAEEGYWIPAKLHGADTRVNIDSLHHSFTLQEIYEETIF